MVMALGSVFFMPEITAQLAKTAFREENVGKTWAPKMAYRAGVINMRFWRYKTGRMILEKALQTFPKEIWVDEALYQIALCYEKSGEKDVAVAGYQTFISMYPDHEWRGQATKRIDTIRADN